MSLTVGLAKDDSYPPKFDGPVFDFDPKNEGYYWFLYPLFEALAGRTGQMIDLYGYAIFGPAQLDGLERMIADARLRVATMPDSWDVEIGTSLGSNLHPTPPTPIYSSVDRWTFADLFGQFESLIAEARRTLRPIVCWGD
jgi:hypothetical protein